MHEPESVLENETQKILWVFERQSHHLISARRPDPIDKKRETVDIWILPSQQTRE